MISNHFHDHEDPEDEKEILWAKELRAFADSRGWTPDETGIVCSTVLSWLFLDSLGHLEGSGRMSCGQYCEFAKRWDRTRLAGLRMVRPEILPLELLLLEKAVQETNCQGDPS